MQRIFQGSTADQVWREMAASFHDGGHYDVIEGRGGATAEMLHVGLSITDPRARWVVSRTPPLNIAFALVEVIWILSGRRDAAFVQFWNSKLTDFVGTDANLHGAYGYRLRHHFGFDQLDSAYRALRSAPHSRQVVLQLWDSRTDLPSADGTPTNSDIPCNVMSILKVRNGRLEWMQIVRSNDLFRGVPYNLVQFTFLQEVFAGWLGLDVGAYSQMSDSLHVYAPDIEAVRSSSLVPASPNIDKYGLPKAESDRVVVDMASRVDRMVSPDLSSVELTSLVRSALVPNAYLNILRVLAAEAARRRRWMSLATELGASCTNPALVQLWNRWLNTRQPRQSDSVAAE